MKKILILFYISFFVTKSLLAQQSGDLDLSFNSGIVITSIGSSNAGAYSVLVQPDGKILAGGWSGKFTLVRYNVNGSLDNSFDSDGKVTTSLGIGSSSIESIALQSDGKILAAGRCDFSGGASFGLARYLSNGTLDSTFSNDGIQTTLVGSNYSGGFAVAIQQDGKIVVAGYSDGVDRNFAVARYKTDGSLDSTFSSDGIVITDITPGAFEYCNAMVIQPDQKILIGGESAGIFALIRYNSNGILDSTFDGDGKLATNFGGGQSEIYSIAIQQNGKIIVGGDLANDTGYFALARYNIDGSLDNSFSGDGIVTTLIGVCSLATSIALQSDGKIVAVGYVCGNNGQGFIIAKYNSDGTLVNDFGSEGKIVTTLTGAETNKAFSVAIQQDNKIVVAGWTCWQSGSIFKIIVARFLSGIDDGIQNISYQNNFDLYPNPTTNQLTIESAKTISTIEISDALGREIYQSKNNLKSEIINLKSFASGIYFIKLYFADGGMEVKKFVKE